MTGNDSAAAKIRGDSLVTLAAICVLAYIGETMGHELVGHGGICILGGGHITALAPLWMRCSVQTVPMVAAGPLFNVVAATIWGAMVRFRTRWNGFTYFLWMSCVFNVLVACGYLVVGGATTFGDWGFVFASVRPSWVWRIAGVVVGVAGYYAGLRALASLYARLAGREGLKSAVLLRRTLLPGAVAAGVACAAEFAGHRVNAGSLGIALGCTLFVAASLSRIGGMAHAPDIEPTGRIRLDAGWIALAVATAAVFILWIGPVVAPGG